MNRKAGISLDKLLARGADVGTFVFANHERGGDYAAEIIARAKTLGYTYAVSGDVNAVVRVAAMDRLCALLDMQASGNRFPVEVIAAVQAARERKLDEAMAAANGGHIPWLDTGVPHVCKPGCIGGHRHREGR